VEYVIDIISFAVDVDIVPFDGVICFGVADPKMPVVP
jgi:hypothetical protein